MEEKMEEMYKKGLSDSKIAKEIGYSKSFVTKWRKANKLKSQLELKNERRMNLYKKGLIDSEIAKIEKTSKDNISSWRKRKKLPSNYIDIEKEKINKRRMELYKKGYNDCEIAKEMNVTNESVREWRDRRNLPNLNSIKTRKDYEEIKLIEDLYNKGYPDTLITKILKEKSSSKVINFRNQRGLPPNGNFTLEKEEDERRMYLYKQGYNDLEMSIELGNIKSGGIGDWRRNKGLPPNYPRYKKYNKNKGIKTLPEEDDEIRKALYEAGYSDKDIAKLLGMSDTAIMNWRDSRKLPPNKQDVSISEDEERLRIKLYSEGLGDNQIAEILGMTNVGVGNWRNSRGIKPNYNDKVKRCENCLEVNAKCKCKLK